MSTIEVAGSSADPTANDQGLFQCGSCKRHYNRLDHLARHVRSHTNFKPHRCSICGKSFSRTDLLKRHVAAHDVRSAKVNNLGRAAAENVPGRVSQACRACAANHVRCTEVKPCRRCAEKGLECVYKSDDILTPTSPVNSQTSQQNLSSSSSMLSSLEVQVAEPMTLDAHYAEPREDAEQYPSHPAPQPGVQFQGGVPPQSAYHPPASGPAAGPVIHPPAFDVVDNFMNAQPELPPGCYIPNLTDWNFLPGLWSAPPSTLAMGQPFRSIDLDDVDLQFLDTYNTEVPFEISGPLFPEPNSYVAPPSMPDLSNMPHPARGASEAFRNYHWQFRPNSKDRGGQEEHNLSLPSNARDTPGPEPQISFSRRVTPARLGPAARDGILSVVIKSIRPDNLRKAIASFPSVELLDALIQFYLNSPLARADSFIHAASFDPNEKRPELLLAMAAAGAILTSDPTLTKLGYAMQECLRTGIPPLWESDNSLVRDLELTQAFLIGLEIGLWSGDGRKVEITENFLQSPLTMFRRGGRFRKAHYPPVVIPGSGTDNEHDNGAAWRSWVERESFKRTAYRLLQLDLNCSMYLMINPIISYAELYLPLPCAPALWTVSSPQQWKSLLTQYPTLADQPPPIADYLDDPGAFKAQYFHYQYHQRHRGDLHPVLLDFPIAEEAFLACAWFLAWDLAATADPSFPVTPEAAGNHHHLQHQQQHQQHTAAASSGPEASAHQQQQQLLQLQHRMRLELVLMHLHTPFEDVQVFAGLEGAESSRAAYPAVLEWVATAAAGTGEATAARRAVCHAGQVVRFASAVGRGMLQGPAALMVYQGALVLWVYALLAGNRAGGKAVATTGKRKGKAKAGDGDAGGGGRSGEVVVPPPDAVWLDGEDDLALQRYTHFGVGTPCLRGSTAAKGGESAVPTSLCDPEGVLGAVIGLLRDNYEGLPKPTLVERLLQLMEALQRSSSGMMDFHRQLDR
ncbi:hypothetical protein C7999DRAFT_18474 [Corynascus novoguineensis]|uniref:Uncharacterized protein n=1 Tax=Corynascus novoguineensis TaxID=1126955 RepID=A0AAN7CKU4_9PEZI|nr:hypothetical protein C7999DRAFT_18474 [Corynascus novoguineensis]